MNKGQVLFGITTITVAVFLIMVDIATWTDFETTSPLGILITAIFIPLAVIGFFVILLNILTGSGVFFSYRAPPPTDYIVIAKKDVSYVSRVIIFENTEEEFIIHGNPAWSYRTALLSEWPIRNFRKSGDWIVKDERGNDISNTPLERYDGLSYLAYRLSEKQDIGDYSEKVKDSNEEYTSIDQGVTYYD